MIFSDVQIKHLLIGNGIIQCPKEPHIGPASLDLRLGNTFKWMKANQVITLGERVEYHTKEIEDDDSFILGPHEFCLATTLERVDLPINIAAFVQGRSSIGRAGLSTQNAGFVDPGFHGHITLELKNETDCPIVLRPGYPVAQLVFMETSPVLHPYDGKYNDQVDATESRMYMDEEARA